MVPQRPQMKHIVNVPRERGASAEVCQWTVSQKQHATIASDASEHSQAVWRPPAGCHSTLSGAASLTGHAGPDTSKETQQLPEHQQQQQTSQGTQTFKPQTKRSSSQTDNSNRGCVFGGVGTGTMFQTTRLALPFQRRHKSRWRSSCVDSSSIGGSDSGIGCSGGGSGSGRVTGCSGPGCKKLTTLKKKGNSNRGDCSRSQDSICTLLLLQPQTL